MDDTDEWWLKIEDIVHYIEDQGTWALAAYTALSVREQVGLVEDIRDFLLNLAKGLQEVRAERDLKNNASMVVATCFPCPALSTTSEGFQFYSASSSSSPVGQILVTF